MKTEERLKNLYNKYKGQKAISNNVIGIVCGYSIHSNSLIMALPENACDGWKIPEKNDFINKKYSKNKNGYYYSCTIVKELKTEIV